MCVCPRVFELERPLLWILARWLEGLGFSLSRGGLVGGVVLIHWVSDVEILCFNDVASRALFWAHVLEDVVLTGTKIFRSSS